jgi:Phage tail protein
MTEPLQLPVFEVGGWAGNTRDDDGVEWWVTGEDGWSGTPGVRLSLADRPQRDGAFDAPSQKAARVITLEGTAIARDRPAKERAKDRLAALLADGSALSQLTVTEPHLTRQAMVRLSDQTKITDRTPVSFDWSVQLTAPDPVRYSERRGPLSCGPPQPSGGLSFPLRFPLDFGSGPVDNRIAVTNAGTVTTWPIWQISGPVTDPVITNTGTGEQLNFGITLPPGAVLTVETAVRSVRMRTTSRRAALRPGSRWFGIEPGTTVVIFNGLHLEEPAGLAVTWRDAWM